MQRESAIAFFEKKIEENPSDVDAHHNLASLYRSMGNHEMYARHSRIAVLTKEGGPKVWNELGLVFLEKGNFEEASGKFRDVIQYWPTFPWSYVNMSAVLAKQGKYQEALPYCLKAIKYAPPSASLHRNTAKIYESIGKSTEALFHYRQALALEPMDAEVTKRISMICLAKKQTDDAKVHYEHYRTITGQHYELKL